MSNKIYELDGFPAWIQDDWQKWYDIAKSYERAIKILLDAEVPDRDVYSPIHPDVFGVDNWIFLKFLNGIDTTGGAFRYPVDPTNKPFFTDQTDRHAIDLAYLYPAARQVFLEVSDFVDQHGGA